jgi:hypothetical protein
LESGNAGGGGVEDHGLVAQVGGQGGGGAVGVNRVVEVDGVGPGAQAGGVEAEAEFDRVVDAALSPREIGRALFWTQRMCLENCARPEAC